MSFAASCNVSNKYLVCRLVINVISPHFQSLWCVCVWVSPIIALMYKAKEDLKDYYRNLPFPYEFLIQ